MPLCHCLGRFVKTNDTFSHTFTSHIATFSHLFSSILDIYVHCTVFLYLLCVKC